MKPFWLRLDPLDGDEVKLIEEFLAPQWSRKSIQTSVERILKERADHYVCLRMGQDSEIKAIRENWRQAIVGPAFGRKNWRPSASLKWTVDFVAYTGAKPKRRLGFTACVEDDFFRWLLVRAVATGQIKRFILCSYCGAAKYAKTSRKNVQFCSDTHRLRFHYVKTRQRSDNFLARIRKLRTQGIPGCVNDIVVLREAGVPEGTKRASRILRGTSLPFHKFDDIEKQMLRNDYVKTAR
jgi:hypothetical protein